MPTLNIPSLEKEPTIPLGPLADWKIGTFFGVEAFGQKDHLPPGVTLLDPCDGPLRNRAIWLVGSNFTEVVRLLKRLVGGKMPGTIEPGQPIVTQEPTIVNIGPFGVLSLDLPQRILCDTFAVEDMSVVHRHIQLPPGPVLVQSAGLTVLSIDYEGHPQWWGSERRRRELEQSEMQMRTSQHRSPRKQPEGEMHRECSLLDHPEGCRARAVQAGFGCVVEQDGSGDVR